MKWLSITNDSHQELYELYDSKDKLLILAYHPASGAIRISANNEKRVFLIGREGFLRTRTVLRNEYGIRIGQLSTEGGPEAHGTIQVYEEEFNYVFRHHSPLKAAIYKNEEMLAVCELPELSDIFSKNNQDILILVLCWYMTVSVKSLEEVFAA